MKEKNRKTENISGRYHYYFQQRVCACHGSWYSGRYCLWTSDFSQKKYDHRKQQWQ